MLNKEALELVKDPFPRVLQQALPGRESDRGVETGHRPLGLQEVYQQDGLQNGHSEVGAGSLEGRGLHDVPGPQGCIFPNPCPPLQQEVTQSKVEFQVSAVQDPLLRPVNGPSGVHKGVRHSVSLGTQKGHPVNRYLDDWLLISASEAVLKDQGVELLRSCRDLGITINMEKSQLVPSDRMTYLGMVLDSKLGKAFPSAERLEKLDQVLLPFLTDIPRRAKDWQRLIGHLVSLEKLVPQGRLKLREVQWNLKELWSPGETPHRVVSVSSETKEALKWWSDRVNTQKGIPFATAPPEMLLLTDASKEGWGAHLQEETAKGKWSQEEKTLHINVLELLAVQKACMRFVHRLQGNTAAPMYDNATVVAYVKNQGGLKSRELCDLTAEILDWAEKEHIELTARFIPGKKNVLADGLSRVGQVVGSEWSLHPEVARTLLGKWGSPEIDLFATRINTQLPVFCSPVPDPTAAFEDTFQHPWDSLDA
ncbi:uncharacterized protein [Palaemon carinicauda]|uniref:uncharacterized protein n=1 Tax=Palaemon carinicauda TaxID=392227 RepID=UPI0035B58468